MIFECEDARATGGLERRSTEQDPQCSESLKRNVAGPHIIERKAPRPGLAVRSTHGDGRTRAVVQLGPAIYYGAGSYAKHLFSRRSRYDAADLGAGRPLAREVSPRRFLGTGACSLLEVLLKHPICHGTGVRCAVR